MVNKVKVILLSRVRKLGNRGDVVFVQKGYFRNYLSKFRFADTFSEKLLSEVKSVNQSSNDVNFQKYFDILNDKSIFLGKEASGNEVLYAAIRATDIVKEIEKDFNIKIPTKNIIINQPMKRLGLFKIEVDCNKAACLNVYIGRSVEEAKKMSLVKPTEEKKVIDEKKTTEEKKGENNE